MNTPTAILSLALVIFGGGGTIAEDAKNKDENQVKKVIHEFEDGLNKKELSRIEAVVDADIVVFENGHRNNGWIDFRDNHLVPEMKESGLEVKSGLVKLTVSKDIAWAYTSAHFILSGAQGATRQAELWSVYVLEKRKGQWKIVLLDWSMRVQKAEVK